MSPATDTHFLEVRGLTLPREELASSLRVAAKPVWRAQLFELIDEAEKLACPKACYKCLHPEFLSDDEVKLGDQVLKSRTLTMAFQKAMEWQGGMLFPFAVTCGTELNDWAAAQQTGLPAYWAQEIAECAMQFAVNKLESVLKQEKGSLSRIEPGIPADWPLTEQGSLFNILGDGPAKIGIQLSELFLMTPFKSVSGIYFLTERFLSPCSYCLFQCERKNGRTCWHRGPNLKES